jgi:peptide/nickel transport system ATP-binding protein
VRVDFRTDRGRVVVVDDVSFTLDQGETLAIVGESGSGKSVTAMSIMGLLDPSARVGGEIRFEDVDLLRLSEPEMDAIRGRSISMIFQEPMTSLNPVFTVGEQIAEVGRIHKGLSAPEARRFAIDMLRLVGISAPERRVDEYPHQLSGGMVQRVMIAIGLACNPRLLIADEPTTALDVTIQAQILDLLDRLVKETRSSLLLITHDFGVVAQMADKVIVMYCGKIVERADVRSLFDRPGHPYTQALMRSMPSLASRDEPLVAIEGNVPPPYDLPSGCRFRTRCPHARSVCAEREPPVNRVGPGHDVSCWMGTDAYAGSDTESR